MKNFRMGNGASIFVIFFGLSVLESLRQKDWRWFGAWCIILMTFLILDNMKRKRTPDKN